MPESLAQLSAGNRELMVFELQVREKCLVHFRAVHVYKSGLIVIRLNNRRTPPSKGYSELVFDHNCKPPDLSQVKAVHLERNSEIIFTKD